MVPGRKYSIDSILHLLRRRWLLIPLFSLAGGAAAAAYAWRIPNFYRSEALLLVRQQIVPQSYVRSSVTTEIDDLVRRLSDRVLAPDSLAAILAEPNANSQPSSLPMQQRVAIVRAGISLSVVRADAFRVAYVARDPVVAARITSVVARALVDENLRSRTGLAEETDQFLNEQLQGTRERLAEHEKQLEAYRQRYAGELPSQLQANLLTIQGIQSQLRDIAESIQKDRDRKLQLEQTLGALTVEDARPVPEPSDVDTPLDPLGEEVLRLRGRDALRQLRGVRTTLQRLQLQLKPDHPDIVRLKSVISELERRVTEDLGPAALTAPPERTAQAAQTAAERRRSIEALRSELRGIDVQVAQRQQQESGLQAALVRYRRRVDAGPTRETEITTLMRDYDTLRDSYQDLLKKREDAQLAAALERQRVGESLYIAVQPGVPREPFAPRRQQIVMLGAIGGFLLSLLAIGWREFRDSTIRTEAEVMAALELPVLAMVPVVTIDADLRRRRTGVVSLVGLLLISVAAALYFGFGLRP